jgi:hypothetical protein
MNRSKKIVWVGFFLCASLWGAPFADNGNGTVTDSATRLVWQKCSAGQGTTLGNCGTGSISWYTLSDAFKFCEELILGGRSDWRLPNINELMSIIDYTKDNPLLIHPYFLTPKSRLIGVRLRKLIIHPECG